MAGDFNKKVGNDELGVTGNHPEITFGGELVRELVASEEFILVNNSEVARGGPFTRWDPSDETKKSCIDLVLASANLMPFIRELVIDKERTFTPMRVIPKGNSLTARYTDHLSLKISLRDLPSSNRKTEIRTKWNLKKPGGWNRYKVATDDIADKIVEIVDSEKDIEEVINKVEKLQNKAKFVAFNKTKIKREKPKNVDALNDLEPSKAHEILTRQSEQIEKEILEIKSSNQGRAYKVFKMRARIGGTKKGAQEAHAIKDPISGELLVATEEIKRATLEYNCNVLKNNEAEEGFEELVKIKEDLHENRMRDKIGKGSFKVTGEDFNKVVKKFEEKRKQSYDFIVKAGQGFKNAVYRLCKRIIENEEIPACFELTILQQIYKGKGSKTDLSNSRFIHLKDWLPRTCDALVVGGMKTKILSSSTKFQIGGQEGHRSQEHLFSLKSVLALMESRGEGILFQLYDIRKFFDHESLRDVLDTLHDVGIDDNVYRAWYMLNKNTRIAVKTGTGLTDVADVGEVIGQGTVGGALASQVNIDRGIDRYFCGSKDEVSFGTVRLQPMVFQDDVARLAWDIKSAQAGNLKLSYVMREKQLKVHPDKTGYIAIGSKDFQARVLEEASEQGWAILDDFIAIPILGGQNCRELVKS